MLIKKEDIVIRSAKVSDAAILTDWWNDGTVMEHAGFPNGLGQSIEETIRQIKAYEGKLSELCIIEIAGKRVGEMSFSIGDNLAEIGIKLCDSYYQNKGYGIKLLKMLIHYLFTDEELNSRVKIEKIILDTNVKNHRAQHVYEKLGFRKVRVRENSWQNQLGQWQSSVDYEMTLKDYQQNR